MRKIFLFILLGIVTFSCIKDPVDISSTSQPGTKVRLITSGYSEVATRATDESTISNVWVLQYINGTLVRKTFLPASTPWSSGFNLPADQMSVGPGNVVYFFSNTTVNGTDPLATDAAFTVDVSTLSDLEAYHFPITEASFDTYLPMRGEYRGAISASTATNIVIQMTRMVAKINFNFDATILNQFIASSIQLCQVPNVITLPANTYQPALPISGATAANPEGFTAYPAGDVFTDYGGQPIGINLTEEGSFTWYMAENARGSFLNVASNLDKYPTSPTINDTENQTKYSYILLKGSCIDNNGNLLDVSYKIYLGGNATGDMNLIANTTYNVTTTITGTNSADTRITANIADITETQSTLNPSNCYILNATGEGQIFFIPVSQAVAGIAQVNAYYGSTALQFTPSSAWSADILWQTWQATSTANQLGVSRATGTDGVDYIRVVLSSGVLNGNNALIALRDAGGNILWSWHLWITDYNPYSSIPANGELHTYAAPAFQVGGWAYNKKFMDRNLGAAWTRGAPNPANITDDATAGKAYGLMYQWGRKDPFPGASGVSLTQAAPIYGGAINNPALTEGTGTGTGINRVAIQTGTTNNLVNAVRNPKTFYYNINTPFDWYVASGNNSSQNNNLWRRPSLGAKSLFDPCPVGYRVPDSGSSLTDVAFNPWVGFGANPNTAAEGPSQNFVWYANGINQGATGTTVTAATGGRLYIVNGVNAWYPATGYRLYRTGELLNNVTGGTIVGEFGCTWSSGNHNALTADYLALAYNYGRPWANSNRAYGFAVRCIQE